MAEKRELRVTIGIPTYNRAGGYLKIALSSALAQQYANLDIVVSDNCSTDHTEALVHGMNDGRIRYFRQPKNILPNDNFNFCLNQAQGDYFLLLHDDDVIDPDFVETCMRVADGNPDIGVIFTGIRTIDADGRVLKENENKTAGLSIDDFFLGWFHGRIALYLCSTLYNTRALKALGGFKSPKDLFQDVVATVQLAAKHGRRDIQAIKAGFRRHGQNRGSSVKVLDWCVDSRYLLDLICRFAAEKKMEVRREGAKFFCRLNYARAAAIADPLARWRTYYQIHRKFDRGYSLYYPFRKYEVANVKRFINQHLSILKPFGKTA